jgi:hypothetical protein
MNLEELKQTIDKIYNLARYPDEIKVVVATNEKTMGSRAFSNVIHVSKGIDWEANQVRIVTEHKLYKEASK